MIIIFDFIIIFHLNFQFIILSIYRPHLVVNLIQKLKFKSDILVKIIIIIYKEYTLPTFFIYFII
jgi:hypothetical protein